MHSGTVDLRLGSFCTSGLRAVRMQEESSVLPYPRPVTSARTLTGYIITQSQNGLSLVLLTVNVLSPTRSGDRGGEYYN